MNRDRWLKWMEMPIMRKVVWRFYHDNAEAIKENSKDRNINDLKAFGDVKHLLATITWLVHAQDQNHDGGVSRAYRAAIIPPSYKKGWQPSYPETTGYIIPTFFAASTYFNESSYAKRALQMADWEIDVQLPSGAVMGSVVTASPSPAVFNTGQVILGWLAAFKNTGDEKYLEAALRAADYLVSVQEPNGSWVKGNSRYASDRATTYNTRVAWALIELGLETNEDKYTNAGKKNIEYGLTKQNNNGWFADNCLNAPESPLLHTIVYATRGVLESGILLKEDRYVNAALKTLDALLGCQLPDGGIPGRLASDWSSKANWDCLTGDAQAAVAWLRAYAITGNGQYEIVARSSIEFVKRSQNLEHSNPGIRGGVKGSFPFDGPYGKYALLNWAAKFFCDALMMVSDEELAKRGIRG